MTISAQSETGLNVGKTQLDIVWHETGRHLLVESSPQGIRSRIKRLRKESIERIVVEATGRYERGGVLAALDAGLPIIVANPLMIRRYAGAVGLLAKADKLDAGLSAQYAAVIKPEIRILALALALVDAWRRQGQG